MPTLKQFVTAAAFVTATFAVPACTPDPAAVRQECNDMARQKRIALQEALLKSGSAGDDTKLEEQVRKELDECLQDHGLPIETK